VNIDQFCINSWIIIEDIVTVPEVRDIWPYQNQVTMRIPSDAVPDETGTPVVYLVIQLEFFVIMKNIIRMIHLGILAEKGCFSGPGFFVEKNGFHFGLFWQNRLRIY
jgi:hypothetical protein